MTATGPRVLRWRSPFIRWAVAVLAMWAIGAPPAAAQTTVLFFDSQVGDYIGGGREQTFTPADGNFSISRNPANGVSLSIRDTALTLSWDLHFSAPAHAALTPGSYAIATRYPLTPFVGLSITGGGRECSDLTGRYVVLEIEYAANGGVLRFAADAEQHCEDHDPALFAAIRYNSTISDTQPFGGLYPRYELTIAPPQNGTVTAVGVSCGGESADCQEGFSAATVASLTATPDAGYTFMGWTGACNGARATTVNINSPKACGAVFAPIVTPAPRSILLWHSEPGDYIGQGDRQVYSPANSVWSIEGTHAGNGVRVSIESIDDQSASRWTLEFRAPLGETLQPGMYPEVSRGTLTTIAGLAVYGNGRHCDVVTGAFVVHEVDIDPVSNVVSSLALDFEHHCEQALNPPLVGRLRINSTVDTRVRNIALSPTSTVVPYTPASLITLGTQLFPRYDVEMAFFKYTAATGWTEVKPYESHTYGWTPQYEDIGTHDFQVWARVKGSVEAYEAWASASVTIIDAPHPKVTTIAPNGSGRIGQPIFFNVGVQGGVAPLEFKFLRRFGGLWKVVLEYGPISTYTWAPTLSDIGTHDVQVWVRNHRSQALFESYGAVTYEVRPPAPLGVTLTGATDPLPAGVARKWCVLTTNAVALLEYQWIRLDADGWRIVAAYGAASPCYEWTPSAADAGEHALQVWVRHAGTTAPYEAWAGSTFTVVSNIPSVTLSPAVPLSAFVGQALTFTAHASGGIGPLQFRFSRLDASGWQMVQDYSTANSYTWTPGLADLGEHVVQVWVRNAGSTTLYDAWAGQTFEIVKSLPTITAFTHDGVFPMLPNTPVQLNAAAVGGSSALEYRFLLYRDGTGWSVLQEYSTATAVTWTPAQAGNYALQLWVRSSGVVDLYEAWASLDFVEVSNTAPLTVHSVEVDKPFPLKAGEAATFTANASGGNAAPLQYRFLRYREASGWVVAREWDTGRNFTWTPTGSDVGEHVMQVWVRNAGSSAYDAWGNSSVFEVAVDPLTTLMMTADVVFPVPAGMPVTWKLQASGGLAPLEYQFWLYQDGVGWSLARDWGLTNTVTWTPGAGSDGSYLVQGWVRNAGSTGVDAWTSSGYFTIGSSSQARIVSIIAEPTLPVTAGTTVTWTAVATGGTAGPLEFQFVRLNETTGVWTIVQSYSGNKRLNWATTAADRGQYVIQVWVRSAGSSAGYEGWAGTGSFAIQ